MTAHLENSYARHRAALDSKLGSDLARTWFETDTVDYWRHQRMYDTILPLIRQNPKTRWLTVGDGRFALDSIKLRRLEPTLDVLPTDIAGSLLEEAKKQGLIADYRVANAEALPMEADSFDFVFCKEAFHHFPRPMIALYEMIRVAARAVILIEPNDAYPPPLPAWLIEQAKMPLRRLLRRRIYPRDFWNYEEIGNYIYAVSQRELEKVCLGLNFPAAAFLEFNDCYENGVEQEKLHPQSPLYRRVRRGIRRADLRCRLGLQAPGMITAILFKGPPREEERRGLEAIGHSWVEFPRNPHL